MSNSTIPFYKETFTTTSDASVTISVKDEYGDKDGTRHGTIISDVVLANGRTDTTRGFFTVSNEGKVMVSCDRTWRDLSITEIRASGICIDKMYADVDRSKLDRII